MAKCANQASIEAEITILGPDVHAGTTKIEGPSGKNGITSIWTDFEVLVPFVSFTCLEQARKISSRNLSFLNSSASFSAREPRDVTDDNMASTTPGAEESRRGRKRLRYEDDWKRKKRKLQKDKGESYRTYKGKERAEK